MKIGYSTLGCPGWTLAHACDQVAQLGYDGLELRLIDGEVIKPAAMDGQRRDEVRDLLAGTGVEVCALASSVKLTGSDAESTVSELRATLDLAAHWGIPVVRVFGGHVPAGDTRAEATRRAASAVTAALADARRLSVRIALETHDDFSAGREAAALLDAVGDPSFVAIWDTVHTWRAGEQADEAWAALGPHVVEIQLKDAVPFGDGKARQTQLGDGEVPVRDSLAVALDAGFDGWLVVEWEKHWQPDLPDPELALPAHREAIAQLMSRVGRDGGEDSVGRDGGEDSVGQDGGENEVSRP